MYFKSKGVSNVVEKQGSVQKARALPGDGCQKSTLLLGVAYKSTIVRRRRAPLLPSWSFQDGGDKNGRKRVFEQSLKVKCFENLKVVDTRPLNVQEHVLENGVVTYFNKEKAHNTDTFHGCKDCDKRFLRKDDLMHHQDTEHSQGAGRVKEAFKDRSYTCDECGEVLFHSI